MVAPGKTQLCSLRTLAGELSTCSANDHYPDTTAWQAPPGARQLTVSVIFGGEWPEILGAIWHDVHEPEALARSLSLRGRLQGCSGPCHQGQGN